MKFNSTLYIYQKEVLEVFEKELDRGDKKIHIVAPPGSGKTIMGLEMISRIEGNHLILVPNITLVYQWKDKLREFFLEKGENLEEIVSTTTDEIKKINIITYQSLTSSSRKNDLIIDRLYDYWYDDYIDLFDNKVDFVNYIENLKNNNIVEYSEKISFYKKKLKKSGGDIVDKILSNNAKDYIKRLQESNIASIIVDEAHHLTSWWSKVVYYLWEKLGENKTKNFNKNYKSGNIGESVISTVLKLTNKNKYSIVANMPNIIGLTATPPYDNIDFFILDDDYSKLLGEVDYYIPTPAVVKSGRLAPWSDLVYFVEPGDDLKKVLEKTNKKLNNYIEKNKKEICDYLFTYIKSHYKKELNKSFKRFINYIKFLKTYSDYDISKYFFDDKISEGLVLEDIAKSIGLFIHFKEVQKGIDMIFIKDSKKLFYELGYIYRAGNFYKFRTQIENMLVYSKSKMKGINRVLEEEFLNLGIDLRCAIITDFLEDREGIINCKYILENLKEYDFLKPTLVSGQGIRMLSNKKTLKKIDTNILEVTKRFERGDIQILIGTRGILGEGWDAPALNTLIDLTGIVAYMSVNQVRGRAIRLDKNNPKKVANIYDIVTYNDGYTKEVDYSRLERKHEKFYGVDDTGIIIRGVNHIYPNIKNNLSNFQTINKNMLKRSDMRDYYYKLWGIGGDYKNKEVFGLDLEINNLEHFIPFINFRVYDSIKFFSLLKDKKNEKIKDIKRELFYRELIKRFLKDFLKNIVKTMKKTDVLPEKFDYKLIEGQTGNFKLVSSYKNDLIVKKFILDISSIFKTISTQKYVLEYPFAYYNGEDIVLKQLPFGLPDSLIKNKNYRNIFKDELKNDFLKSGFLLNIGKIVDRTIKVPIIGGGGYGAYLLAFTLPTIGASIWGFATLSAIGLGFLAKPLFYNKRNKLITQYKKIFNKVVTGYWLYSYRFVYLNAKNIDKEKYIGKEPIIKAKIEKIWI